MKFGNFVSYKLWQFEDAETEYWSSRRTRAKSYSHPYTVPSFLVLPGTEF